MFAPQGRGRIGGGKAGIADGSWLMAHGGRKRGSEDKATTECGTPRGYPNTQRVSECGITEHVAVPRRGVTDSGPAPSLYTAIEIASTSVIPAKAGIHKNPGFRVKPGMTNQDKAYVVMYDYYWLEEAGARGLRLFMPTT